MLHAAYRQTGPWDYLRFTTWSSDISPLALVPVFPHHNTHIHTHTRHARIKHQHYPSPCTSPSESHRHGPCTCWVSPRKPARQPDRLQDSCLGICTTLDHDPDSEFSSSRASASHGSPSLRSDEPQLTSRARQDSFLASKALVWVRTRTSTRTAGSDRRKV